MIHRHKELGVDGIFKDASNTTRIYSDHFPVLKLNRTTNGIIGIGFVNGNGAEIAGLAVSNDGKELRYYLPTGEYKLVAFQE